MKRMTVIIPTKNRPGFLLKTLGSLIESAEGKEMEVIVVDDGSESQMMHKNMEVCRNFEKNNKYLYIESRGPAGARNMAIGLAEAPILLFAGDDVRFSGETIEEHLRFHETSNKAVFFAMTGEIKWDESVSNKAMIKFLQREELQFLKKDSGGDMSETDFNSFYSSNLSLKKEFLVRNGLYFDESFPYAAWEDIELGYRCQKSGMKIFFNSNAPVYHFHDQTLQNVAERMERSGMSLRILLKKWPELSKNFGYRYMKGTFRRERNFIKTLFRNRAVVSLMEKKLFSTAADEEIEGINAFFLKSVFSYYLHKGFKKGIVKENG